MTDLILIGLYHTGSNYSILSGGFRISIHLIRAAANRTREPLHTVLFIRHQKLVVTVRPKPEQLPRNLRNLEEGEQIDQIVSKNSFGYR